jgi:putative ABC transport system ATP-binding protein
MRPSEHLIEVKDVWKKYVIGKVEYPALNGVSLDVSAGEFVAIMGPSGSGKTTLLNIIGALDRPTKGEVLIDGVPLSRMSDDELAELRNKKIGFVFQTFNLVNYMTALENVELPMMVLGLPPKERRERALRILERFLDKRLINKRPLELSGGEQQRVAIARALANDPDIIIADEPTGNLDSVSARAVMEVFKGLRDEGKTVVMATHNPENTKYCDRIVRMRDGRIVEVIAK